MIECSPEPLPSVIAPLLSGYEEADEATEVVSNCMQLCIHATLFDRRLEGRAVRFEVCCDNQDGLMISSLVSRPVHDPNTYTHIAPSISATIRCFGRRIDKRNSLQLMKISPLSRQRLATHCLPWLFSK